MTAPTMKEKTSHHGRNVKRIREMLGIKQDALAFDLNMSQQNMSVLENKETIDDELMEQIAKILKMPAEAIKNFDEEKAINFISNTFHDSLNGSAVASTLFNCTFNALDKYVEVVEKNEKLYQQLLKEKDEKNALLERLLSKLK